MIYRIEAACGSSIGRVRENNEDNFLFDGRFLPLNNQGQYPPLYLYGNYSGDVCMAVFDGMGGGEHGEAASFTAAESVHTIQDASAVNAEQFLENACLQANRDVWQAQQALGVQNMGTTLAMLYFQEGTVYATNVGDSRIFALRGDRMVQISKDHTDEAYMQKQGITGRRPRLTQYLGMDPGDVRIEPYIARGQLQPGDVYLICSDGLTDMLNNEEICRLLTVGGTATACVDALISAALKNGGRDNVTVIVCRILEAREPLGNEPALDGTGIDSLSKGQKLLNRIQSAAQKLWKHN